MSTDKAYLQDVGMADLPFPMRVASQVEPTGQATVATISISARILADFEANWIDRFIQVLHSHRDRICTATLKSNLADYITHLQAKSVRVRFDYPFFVEKKTPVSGEKCLVQYLCAFTASAGSGSSVPAVNFRIRIPVVTTYPGSTGDAPGGLFGQRSLVTIEARSQTDIFPEELVTLVDDFAVSPLYSFLTRDDQEFVIKRIHSQHTTSVELVDKVKNALARRADIEWYSVTSANYGMLHSYSTMIGTEKNRWTPSSSFDDDDI